MESGKNENKRDRKQKKAAVQNQSTAAFSQVLGWLDAGSNYSSTTSSTSIGHAFAQIPQAIHLEAGLPSVTTIRPNGHASAHLPQPTHFFLLIM
jgi:hypothetical protein